MQQWHKNADRLLLKLSDWLWSMLLIAPAEFLGALERKATMKRIVWYAAFAVLAYGFAQIFTFDIAMGFALDAATYIDIAAAIAVIAVQARVMYGARVVREHAKKIARSLYRTLQLRSVGRERRTPSLLRRPPDSGEDEGAGWRWSPAF